ncbi:hypothetical protein ACSCB1_40955 [Streptomyces europaeiscabiei]|uniref:Lipoprotein n=1 Tax=Streptomyces europaeiscabiei TaxID=146819 RepID=A0ABU4NLF8_9ACTN|nr:hypothetical protein [Streptomyces europaeiscabiei]MDX3546127.1 hypothetical protein [Streptomyces europaeiscabiei]MDX3557567.1 hypothetical protein [Streptomyces europaeiscabiei]MDX3703526.1 hypothetical protein [Streptomyces europaeiscabiei]
MRRTPAPTGTAARSPRRPWPTLATAALAAFAALALAACGTEKADVGGPQSSPAGAAGARPDAAFTEMLSEIARQCPPSGPAQAPPSGPAEAPPTGLPESLPSGSAESLPPGETPPSDAIEPIVPTAGPEVELNARDWCAGNHHELRITQALWDLADPTPTKVRTVLNDLGYIDERIHDLKQSGTTTRFSLDLRDQGGRLCLDGSVAGEETVVEKCVAPATGPFTPGDRKE